MDARFQAIEMANFYVQLVNSLTDNTIDNLKINKLLYFAQGWDLANNHQCLFADEIQAWEYGPVVPAVYHAFKYCGKNPIEEPTEPFDESRLTSQELDLLVNFYTVYGIFTGWALKDVTHQKGSPWDQVYEPGKNRIISVVSMTAFFETENLSTFDISSLSIPIVAKIPDDWDSEEDAVYD